MKIFGFYIVHQNIVDACLQKSAEIKSLEAVVERKTVEYNELKSCYDSLQQRSAELSTELGQTKDDILYRDGLIRDLKAKNEDLRKTNQQMSVALSQEQAALRAAKEKHEKMKEKFEHELSENSKLQNLYLAKSKELEVKSNQLDAIIAEGDTFGKKLAADERDNYVCLAANEYERLKVDAEKYRDRRERHNVNQRKHRAAKKVAQGKPE